MYLGRDADGRKKYGRITFHGGRRAAEERLASLVVEAGGGAHDVTDGTFEDLSTQWLAIARPSLSPTTVTGYEQILASTLLPRFGKVKLRALRASNLDAFYAELLKKPLSPQTIGHVHALIRHILNQGVKWGWLASNPALNATPPKVHRKDINPPAPKDILRLIAQAEPDLGMFLRLAAVTGARRGEICALQWSDLDVKEETLTIGHAIVGGRNDLLVRRQTKTGNSRTIALDSVTIKSLEAHRQTCDARAEKAGGTLAEDAYVISADLEGKKPRRPAAVTLAFARLKNDLGLQTVTIQGMRHTVATQLLAAGVPVRTVAGRLGHSQPSTTLDVYASWLPESDREAADALGKLLEG